MHASPAAILSMPSLRAARRPRWALNAAAAAGIGALAWLIFSRAFVNYDTLYALIWGRDLVHGRSPDYEVTPRPHPASARGGGRSGSFLRSERTAATRRCC